RARSRSAAARPRAGRRSRGRAAPARSPPAAPGSSPVPGRPRSRPSPRPPRRLLWSWSPPRVVEGGARAFTGNHRCPQRVAGGAADAIGRAVQRGPRTGEDLPGDARRVFGCPHLAHAEPALGVELRVPLGQREAAGGNRADASPGPV